jgi:hypothetical protein
MWINSTIGESQKKLPKVGSWILMQITQTAQEKNHKLEDFLTGRRNQ